MKTIFSLLMALILVSFVLAQYGDDGEGGGSYEFQEPDEITNALASGGSGVIPDGAASIEVMLNGEKVLLPPGTSVVNGYLKPGFTPITYAGTKQLYDGDFLLKEDGSAECAVTSPENNEDGEEEPVGETCSVGIPGALPGNVELSSGGSVGNGDGSTFDISDMTPQELAGLDALYGGDGSDSLNLNNEQLTVSGGQRIEEDSATIEGNIEGSVYSDGSFVEQADYVNWHDGGSASGVTNGIIKDNGNYYFSHVDSLVDKDIAVINGKDVYKVENCFGAGSADTIKKGTSLSSDTIDFLNCDNTIEIEKANAVSIDNSMLNHIKNSTFTLDNNKLTDADIMSGKDNNSFMLKNGINVLADNGEMFNAKFSDDGTIIKTNDSMTISNGFEIGVF